MTLFASIASFVAEPAMPPRVLRGFGGAVLLAALLSGCGSAADAGGGKDGPDAAARAAEALRPLSEKKHKAREGDWLDRFDEPGQTFREYRASDPVRPDADRSTLALVLLGDFDEARRGIVEKTAAFMGLYFGLPVKFLAPLDLSVIPDRARRVHPAWGMAQINASHVLEEVLRPRVPDDAVALIAFTSSDLWPGPGWNFVFGLASLRERVGVWSIYRNGDPSESEATAAQCLRRTVKTGTHETGHMLGMRHCILYECNMNGSNHREESDRAPLALCPECVRKIWWACPADPVERYRGLEDFCRRHDLEAEAEGYRKAREAVEGIFAEERAREGGEGGGKGE